MGEGSSFAFSSEHGGLHWVELNTRDPEKAKAFYGALLGWAFEEAPMGDGATYVLARAGGALVAGIFHMTAPEMADEAEHWREYFAVTDVDAACAAATAAGGGVAQAPFDVPGVGRFAIIDDAGGASLGIVQPDPSAEGCD